MRAIAQLLATLSRRWGRRWGRRLALAAFRPEAFEQSRFSNKSSRDKSFRNKSEDRRYSILTKSEARFAAILMNIY
jgi:hypothetical protein